MSPSLNKYIKNIDSNYIYFEDLKYFTSSENKVCYYEKFVLYWKYFTRPAEGDKM